MYSHSSSRESNLRVVGFYDKGSDVLKANFSIEYTAPHVCRAPALIYSCRAYGQLGAAAGRIEKNDSSLPSRRKASLRQSGTSLCSTRKFGPRNEDKPGRVPEVHRLRTFYDSANS